MSNLIANLDNRMNPIVVKELRQGMQSRFIIIVVNLMLVALTLMCVLTVLTNPAIAEEATGGDAIFYGTYVILLIGSMICIPLYSAARLQSERNGAHVDLFFTTTIEPHVIIRGKFIACMSLVTLLYSLCLPFMLFSNVLRGFDIPTILFLLAYCYVLTSLTVMGSLVVGSWKIPRAMTPILAFVAFVILLFSVLVIHTSLVPLLLFGGVQNLLREPGTLGMLAIFLVTVFLIAKLQEAAAIGLIQPPSNNRTRRLRVWATISIVTMMIIPPAIMIMAHWLFSSGPIDFRDVLIAFGSPSSFWNLLSMMIITATMVLAMGEPDGFSRRIMQNRPRNVFLRTVAFAYTHGASGGFCWAIGHAIVVQGSTLLILMLLNPSGMDNDFIETLFDGFTFTFLCLGFYALLTKILMRTVLQRIPLKFAWAVFLSLIGIFAILSMLIYFSTDPINWDDNPLWQAFFPLPTSSKHMPFLVPIEAFGFLVMATLCLPQGLRDWKQYVLQR